MIRAISSIFAVALVARTSGETAEGTPVSPCPNVFTYEPPGTEVGKWYGVVNLTTDTTLYALWLNIVLESKADILGNWVGEVTTEDNLDFKIENTKMTISPGPPLSVRFFIQYDSKDSPPRLKFIRFNGKEICQVNHPQDELEPDNENKSEGIVFGKPITTTAKSFDRLQTTLKPPYWQQTKVDNYQVKSENTQVTLKPQYWTPVKTEEKTTPRSPVWPHLVKNQQVTIETKTTNSFSDRSQQEIVKKEQPASQLWSKPKVENNQQINSIDKSQTRIETKPQNIAENKTQPWSYTKVEYNQHPKSQERHLKPEGKYQTTSTSTTEKSSQSHIPTQSWSFKVGNQETKSDHRLLQTGNNPIQGTYKEQTTTKKPQGLGYTDGRSRVEPKTGQDEVLEEKQTWSDEWLSNWSGDKSLSWNEQSKNKNDFVLADESSNYTDDGRVKNLDDGSLSYKQLTTEYSPSGTTNPPPVAEFEDDPPKKVENIDYYFGGLPAIYIPHHGHRAVQTQCGKVILNRLPANSIRGSTTMEGQWPWQVAVYQQQSTVDFKYICGGTLVSRRHVITAAHCVTRKGSSRVVNKNTLTVYLGKHNLRTSVDGVQVKFVNRILIPVEYNATTFKGDLAILEFRGPITYSEWVQPACLWPENEDLKSIVGKRGSVVGWGFDVTGLPREELRLLQMRPVDQDTCINSKVKQYAEFYRRFTSDLTYCAGYNEGYVDCNGDSGGGMMFEKDDTWYLRGVASLSVARQGEYLCDPDHYVIFTDTAKFLSWIEEYVDDY